MALDSRRIRVGSLNVANASERLVADVQDLEIGSFYAVPRYGASLGTWACTIQHALGYSTPANFDPALSFNSSSLSSTDVDLRGTGEVVFTNSVAGTSGVVDIWLLGKSD